MAGGEIDLSKIILLEEIIIKKADPWNITSVQRFGEIFNDSKFKREQGIEGLCYQPKIRGVFNFKPLKIIWDGVYVKMLRPLFAYGDGGFEFLNRFIRGKGVLFYENKLILPNNSGLVFRHPVKNKEVLEKLSLR